MPPNRLALAPGGLSAWAAWGSWLASSGWLAVDGCGEESLSELRELGVSNPDPEDTPVECVDCGCDTGGRVGVGSKLVKPMESPGPLIARTTMGNAPRIGGTGLGPELGWRYSQRSCGRRVMSFFFSCFHVTGGAGECAQHPAALRTVVKFAGSKKNQPLIAWPA